MRIVFNKSMIITLILVTAFVFLLAFHASQSHEKVNPNKVLLEVVVRPWSNWIKEQPIEKNYLIELRKGDKLNLPSIQGYDERIYVSDIAIDSIIISTFNLVKLKNGTIERNLFLREEQKHSIKLGETIELLTDSGRRSFL